MSAEARPIRILAVDDHPVVRQGFAGLVSVYSDTSLVAEASNVREAIQQFRTHHPDVTLTDLQMPEMTGPDAMIAIRSEFPDARILVLTTYAGDALCKRTMQAGAQAYIVERFRREMRQTKLRGIYGPRDRVSKLRDIVNHSLATDGKTRFGKSCG